METPLPLPAEEALEPAAPVLDQQMLDLYLHKLSMEQHLLKGLAAGLLAAVVGGVAWAAVTVVTGYQIGYMAVAVGFLVGYAIRTMGQGIDKIFGVLGAVLALFGCMLGNFLSTTGFIAQELDMGYLETLLALDYSLLPEIMAETFSPMDALFYGIALYQGYKVSFRQLTQEELVANASAPVAA